jgi:hypothetical protein
VPRLLVAYDVDAEGEKGAERLGQLSPRMRRIRAPVGKDVTVFWQAGGRVRDWIRFELARVCGPQAWGAAVHQGGADRLMRATEPRLTERVAYRTDSSRCGAVKSPAAPGCSTAPKASNAAR